MRFGILLPALALALAAALPARAAGYGDWAAIVVSGDWHAHSGAPSEVFDNARRDIAADLTHMGFQPTNVEQFSANPNLSPDSHAQHSDAQTIANALWDLSNRTSGGCLAYFTSHGSPDGIVMDDRIFSPDSMQRILANACGDRPTVVIVSACFSGVFVPVLAAPDRFVFTAARPDRTSFGCGESDKYTFFDTCFLTDLPANSDFPDLARAVQSCVAQREQKEKVDYPSEPQLYVGADMPAKLPKWR
jgi:hypothetical protein